ncbi:Ltp family lipoprotein [Paeniglutamicibacter sp. R2-26]|uniref:Ltp family lipoprotein n=1 Tax=Paeniglutamicibacter sp. R2-26 TaxID=3144417 RepID=UPI003EE808EE
MKKLASLALIAALGFGLTACSDTAGATGADSSASKSSTSAKAADKPKEKAEKKEKDVPTEYKSALKSAENYSDMMHMSKDGIYDQLTSEYGGKFSKKAAQYAVDNVEADWNKNALESAKSYQDTMAMSPEAIRDQLTSSYGGKFTKSEAAYAIKNLD